MRDRASRVPDQISDDQLARARAMVRCCPPSDLCDYSLDNCWATVKLLREQLMTAEAGGDPDPDEPDHISQLHSSIASGIADLEYFLGLPEYIQDSSRKALLLPVAANDLDARYYRLFIEKKEEKEGHGAYNMGGPRVEPSL